MVPDDLDSLPMEELVKRLEELGLQTTGTRAALRERLRKAIEGESSQTADGRGNDGGNDMTTEMRLEALSKDQLKQKLRELNLPTTGLKAVLRERLRAALQKDSSDENGDDGDEDDENGDDGNEDEGEMADGVEEAVTTPIRNRGARIATHCDANVATPKHNRNARAVRPRELNYEMLDERRMKPVTLIQRCRGRSHNLQR